MESGFPKDFHSATEKARCLFSKIIRTEPDNVAIVASVSYAVATAAAHVLSKVMNKEDDSEKAILLLDNQYISNTWMWQKLAEKTSCRLIFAKNSTKHATANIIKTIENERPSLVALPTMVHWCDGATIDITSISKVCRKLGALLFLDGTQSIGAVPFDVSKVKPDYLAVAAYKWLCCPYGLGFMYVDPSHHTMQPLELHAFSQILGGFTINGSYDSVRSYENLEEGFQLGARRFDVGQTSNWVLLSMACSSLQQVLDWENNQAIVCHTRPLILHACRRACKLNMFVPENPSPHIVGFRFQAQDEIKPADLRELNAELAENQIHVSIRGDALRLSLHVWNSKADVDRLFDHLAAFLQSKRTGI